MPFVGRGEELLRLRQMWARAMRGLGGVAVVSGEAGIGKSRLITEFGATVVAQGGTIVAGAATFPEAMPYQAVIEALRSALPSLARLPLDPTWLAAAADVLPDLRDGDAALPRLSALEPDRQQDRLFEAVWRCFESWRASHRCCSCSRTSIGPDRPRSTCSPISRAERAAIPSWWS